VENEAEYTKHKVSSLHWLLWCGLNRRGLCVADLTDSPECCVG